MISWNPCMSFRLDPMIVPSAANTIADEHHEHQRQRQRRRSPCGRNPAIRQTVSTSVP